MPQRWWCAREKLFNIEIVKFSTKNHE
jgi:hypothetical protein